MRKRVTFVEHQRKGENLLKDGSGQMCVRSAEPKRRCEEGFIYLHSQQGSDVHRGTHIKVAGTQQMRTIHIPKSMMTAPFLQHPALTTGQKRYLYSIASVYSTEHMRRQMKQHYLNMLDTCIKSGQSSKGRRYGDHLHKDECMIKVDNEKDLGPRIKPQERRTNSSAVHAKIILPKIDN